MKTQLLACCLTAVAFFPAYADESEEASDEMQTDGSPDLTPELQRQLEERLVQFDELMARQDRGFVIPPPNSGPMDDPPEYSGQWIEQDGVKKCDGYLTRFPDDEFCSAEKPSDWVPFEFEGMTFYIQPLSNNGG